MRNIYLIAITFFLSSCTTLEYELGIQSDIEKEGNAQIILDQLNDSELRKGKVFVFSNIRDGLFHYVRVNETERYMRDQEVQVFDLKYNNIILSPKLSELRSRSEASTKVQLGAKEFTVLPSLLCDVLTNISTLPALPGANELTASMSPLSFACTL